MAVDIIDKSYVYFTPDPDISMHNKEPAYFGYSMTSYKSGSYSWLLVGAPKSNLSSNHFSPGVVQSCRVSQENTTCKLSHHYQDNETLWRDQMFGATLFSHESNGTKEIIVCGFRKVLLSKSSPLSPGACSVFRNDRDVTSFHAPGEDVMYFFDEASGFHKGYYFRSFAQIGFSLHKSQEEHRQLFGAPGLMSWKGGVNIRSGGKECSYYNVTAEHVELAGYAVASLKKLGKKHLTLLSAPKYNGFGKVSILDIDDYCEATLKQVINTSCFECMFGSSLLALDVDEDGTDEILVGAPFYNLTKGDEGAVFVYKEINGIYKEVAMLTGRRKSGSRFGTTLYSLEDINMDGFKDIIVGSPYEGQGVAYLYLGMNGTFESNYSQMIDASTVGSHLMRFGYSFHVLPLTGSYGGLAIGSYLSDLVVFMKIRPQHTISAEIKFYPPNVSWIKSNCIEFLNQTSTVNISLVFSYIIKSNEINKYGNRFYRDTEITYELEIDVDNRRGYLIDHGQKKVHNVIKALLFQENKMTVVQNWTINFDIKKQPLFASQPVNFVLNVKVSKFDLEINPSFNLSYLELFEIPFREEPESIQCFPDISFELTIERPLIVGARSTAIIGVFLRNHGDSTYHTEFSLDHGLFLTLINITKTNYVKCNTHTSGVQSCEINTLILKDLIHFDIHLAMKENSFSNNIALIKLIPFHEHGHTTLINLPLWYQSEIIVIKASNATINENSSEIVHFYDVRNIGPGMHPNLFISIFVPSISTICCMWNFVEVKTRSMRKSSTILDIFKTENNLGIDLMHFTDFNVNLTCSYAECQEYQFKLPNMQPGDTVDLRIIITINGSLSAQLKKLKKFTIESQIVLQPNLVNESKESFENSNLNRSYLRVLLKSSHLSHSNEKQIPWWLLLTCLLIGIIHLVVLILLLKRCGFFRRRGREMLEKEKNLIEATKLNSQNLLENQSPVEEELEQKTFV